MEANKPPYSEIEKELEEYKTLLWQLSDEYKLNVGNAEKKVAELEEKCQELEKLQVQPVVENSRDAENNQIKAVSDLSVVTNSGIASCVINKNGKIIDINNKLKFLIELLSFDIESVNNIKQIFKKIGNQKVLEDYELFEKSEDLSFQSLLTTKNSFNSSVNIMLRINPCTSGDNYLALFVEISGIEDLDINNNKDKAEKQVESEVVQQVVDSNKSDNEIEIFAEKYEVYQKLLKVFGSKKRKKPEILPENMYIGFVRAFNLEQDRQNILNNLNYTYHDFSKKLKSRFARLTSNEEKHCMLIKAGLSYKEISAIMNISVNGVKIARNRLRKKLRIDNETTINFIKNI